MIHGTHCIVFFVSTGVGLLGRIYNLTNCLCSSIQHTHYMTELSYDLCHNLLHIFCQLCNCLPYKSECCWWMCVAVEATYFPHVLSSKIIVILRFCCFYHSLFHLTIFSPNLHCLVLPDTHMHLIKIYKINYWSVCFL